MLRKTLVALTAVAALGAVALAPTTASAGGGGKGGGGKGGGFGHHHFHGGFSYRAGGGDYCWRPVLTRWGTVKYVYVCGTY